MARAGKPFRITRIASNPAGNPEPAELVVVGTIPAAAIGAKSQYTALTPVSTANATDTATAVALANANKAAINAIITALKA